MTTSLKRLCVFGICMVFGVLLGAASNHLNLQQQSNGIAVFVDGKLVGNAVSLNFNSGTGLMQVCSAAGNQINCSPSYNTATLATKATLQSGACQNINSGNGTIQYTATLGPTCQALAGYVVGMRFWLVTDAQCAAGCSLDIDKQGVVAIKRADGSTDPGGLFDFTQGVPIRYDGKVFRIEWQR